MPGLGSKTAQSHHNDVFGNVSTGFAKSAYIKKPVNGRNTAGTNTNPVRKRNVSTNKSVDKSANPMGRSFADQMTRGSSKV